MLVGENTYLAKIKASTVSYLQNQQKHRLCGKNNKKKRRILSNNDEISY